MRIGFVGPALVLLLLLLPGGLWGFTFSPISQDFSSEGRDSSHVFTIHNDSQTERIAVKVSLWKRTMDEEGREELSPCPGEFLIYPAQSILAPGEERSVRIKWQGGPVTGRERNYRIVAEQLPVDFQEENVREEGGGIRFTFRYEGSLYVVPREARADVSLESVKTEYRDGEPYLALVFENRGSRHAILNQLEIRLDSPYDNFETISLEGEDLAGVSGENILAGNRRVFLIPEPPAVQGEDLLWQFSFSPVY